MSMSIMRLQKNMGKYTKWVVYAFVVIFTVGSIFVLGPISRFQAGPAAAAAPSPIAVVNRTQITREEFNALLARQWEQARLFGGLSPTQIPFLKQQTLDSLVQQTLQLEAARREGVRVTSRDVIERLQQHVSQEVMMHKFREGEKAFRRAIREQYGSEEDYINHLVDSVSSPEREAVREQLMLEKLEQTVKDRVKVSEREYREHMRQAKARLIVVHAPSEPASPGKSQADTSADAAAKAKAEAILKEIRSGADFAALAKEKSDDFATKDKGGLIAGYAPPEATPQQKEEAEWFKRGDNKFQHGDEFEEVVFKRLAPGAVSDVFKGTRGYYIVKLEARKQALPDDYNDIDYQCNEKKHEYTWTQSGGEVKQCPQCNGKNIEVVSTKPAPPGAPKGTETKEYRCPEKKHTYTWTEKGKEAQQCPQCGSKKIEVASRRRDNYLQTFEDSKKNEAWSKYLEDLRNNAKIEIYDPELKAYKLQNDLYSVSDEKERKKQLQEIIDSYKQALQYVQGDLFIKPAVLHYRTAQAYQELGDKKKQVEALETAVKQEESAELRMELGRLYKEEKKTKQALEQFQKASDLVPPQQYYIHTQLAEEFKQLKRNDLAEKEKKLAKPPDRPSIPSSINLP